MFTARIVFWSGIFLLTLISRLKNLQWIPLVFWYVVPFNVLEFVLSVFSCFVCEAKWYDGKGLGFKVRQAWIWFQAPFWLWALSFSVPPCFIWNGKDNTYLRGGNEILWSTYAELFPTPLQCTSSALVSSIFLMYMLFSLIPFPFLGFYLLLFIHI